MILRRVRLPDKDKPDFIVDSKGNTKKVEKEEVVGMTALNMSEPDDFWDEDDLKPNTAEPIQCEGCQ